jgi:hypothetical protein
MYLAVFAHAVGQRRGMPDAGCDGEPHQPVLPCCSVASTLCALEPEAAAVCVFWAKVRIWDRPGFFAVRARPAESTRQIYSITQPAGQVPRVRGTCGVVLLPARHPILNEHLAHPGDVVFRHACKLGLEGIVSKRLGSPYRSGRSRDWLQEPGGARGGSGKPRRTGARTDGDDGSLPEAGR